MNLIIYLIFVIAALVIHYAGAAFTLSFYYWSFSYLSPGSWPPPIRTLVLISVILSSLYMYIKEMNRIGQESEKTRSIR